VLAFFFFTLAQRAFTAFLALSLRSSAVMLAALAGPPFKPPLRPRATAAAFFFCVVGIRKAYVTAHAKTSIIVLTIRDRSRIILSIEKALPALTDKARFEIQTRLLTLASKQIHCEPIA
jgi:hypothetical protein